MNKKKFYKKKPQTEIEYIPQGDEKVLSTLVDELGLHPKTKELFKNSNINTVYDIAKRNQKQLFKIQGFGKKDLIGVERELEKLGIALAPVIDEQPQVEDNKVSIQAVKEQPKPLNTATDKNQPRTQQKNFPPKTNEAKPNQTKPNQNNNQNQPKKFNERPRQENKNEFRREVKGDKVGIVKGGVVIIPVMYDEVFMPKEDMVCVDVDGVFGYVNMQNEMVIEPKYELAQSFSQGLANVMLNDKYGYIDKNGETVLEFQYELATPFEDDETARVKIDGRWGSITKEGKITWI